LRERAASRSPLALSDKKIRRTTERKKLDAESLKRASRKRPSEAPQDYFAKTIPRISRSCYVERRRKKKKKKRRRRRR